MIKVNQAKLAAIKSSEVRAERDALIAASDWAMMPDAPTDKEAWGAYRKALREVPQQDGFPVKAVWPVPPVVVSGE
ncbi:phage tail assembly chaperone [Cronobacter turicensis]|nr:phage tail assembly chaperone [Cronobacter turicensis]ELY3628159.1 phage tail assembly chaperone [Cronobacter turicensis]